MFKPSGIYAAMLTPFTDDGSVNEQVVREMVDFMVAKGLHGIFPVSSVGEFVHMSLDQCMHLMEVVVDQAAGRVAVTPGIGATCVMNSIKLAQKAKELGCEAVVLCPPYYYPINQENLGEYFETVADSVDIPVILYNIPLFATPISNDVIQRLCPKSNIVGMKDSSGSMVELMHYIDIIRKNGSAMNILTGREDMLAPALTVGVKGCMTACAGIFPEIMLGIWEAYHGGDWEKAKRLQFALLPVIRVLFSPPFPLGFKAAMEVRGFAMGPAMKPLSAVEKNHFHAVKSNIKIAIDELLQVIKREGLAK